MFKTSIALVALASASIGWSHHEAPRTLKLKEERMTIEFTATTGEAVVVFEAESEAPLSFVGVHAPTGPEVLSMQSADKRNSALSGFIIEARETTILDLMSAYPEGEYRLQADTLDGRAADGMARLSHRLLPMPEVIFPFEGAHDIPAADLVVTWIPDPRAEQYRIVLEQGDDDNLAAVLPGSQNTFRVPNGVLAPNTLSHVEIGAVGRNGNCTLVEIQFTTR